MFAGPGNEGARRSKHTSFGGGHSEVHSGMAPPKGNSTALQVFGGEDEFIAAKVRLGAVASLPPSSCAKQLVRNLSIWTMSSFECMNLPTMKSSWPRNFCSLTSIVVNASCTTLRDKKYRAPAMYK